MILILVLLIGLYFFPVIFGNQVFYYGDIVSIFLPFKQFFFENIRHGVLPLWNPYIYSGYPMFADMTLGNFYPPSWILFFSSSIKAVSWLIIAHFFVAGYFTYRLGQLLKLSREAAFFSAVIYTFSGIMINYIADPQRFFVISLFPFFFYALFKGKIILIALALSLQIFAGHIQYVFIELLASLMFWRRWKVLAVAGVLAGLLTAVSLLPMLEFIPYTTRPGAYTDLSIYQNFSLHPVSLVRLVLAHFWGIKNQGFQWGTLDTTTIGYLGFLPLLVILLTIKSLLKNRTTLKFLLISGLSLIISFGTFLPFFKIFTTYIPIFRLFRNPMAFLSLYSLLMALVSGFAWQYIKFPRISRRWAGGFFLTAALSLLAIIALKFDSSLPHQLLLSAAAIIGKSLSAFHTEYIDYRIVDGILKNWLLVSVLAALAFFSKNKTGLIFLTVVDLFIFTRSNYYTVDQKFFSLANPAREFLQQNLGEYRYLSSSEAVPYSGLNDFFGMLNTQPLPVGEAAGRLAGQLLIMPPNFGMVYNLPTINGYTSFVDRSYLNLFSGSKELNQNYQAFVEYNPLIANRPKDLDLSKLDLSRIDLNDPIFDYLAIKYFVTDRDIGLPAEQLAVHSGDLSIYENDQVMSRAVLFNDQGEIIETPAVTSLNPNQLALQLKNAGKLVIFDINYPGWQAMVNGRRVSLEPYQDIFRSVAINQPDSQVGFDFRPRSFYIGLWISLLSFLLLSFWLLI